MMETHFDQYMTPYLHDCFLVFQHAHTLYKHWVAIELRARSGITGLFGFNQNNVMLP
jgi:hypothetical protein